MTHDEATPPPTLGPGQKEDWPGPRGRERSMSLAQFEVFQKTQAKLKADREAEEARVRALEARATAAEAALTRFQNEVWGAFQTWSMALGWGITGMQPECYAMMDASIDRMLSAEAEAERLKARVGVLEEGLKGSLATLVAALSIIDCAVTANVSPKYVVASDAMFAMMRLDYAKAEGKARAALVQEVKP